jgi:hypothetical protein
MRNVVLTAALLGLAAGLAAAQSFSTTPQTLQAPAPAGPWAQKIFFGVTSHDFGTVPHGAQLKHRFKMKNIYQVPLQLTEIRSSCGCLTPTPSTRLHQPEEEGYIDINMDARRFKGPKQIHLFITVGPQFVSTATILVTANARADVVFNPGQVDFGIVPQGQGFTQAVDVEYAGTMDWRILQVVKNADAPFTVTPKELYRSSAVFRNNKVGYQIAVTLKPTAAPGPFREELMLKTNDPTSPMLTLAVEGNIQGSLSVAPSTVNLGPVKLGTSKTQRVQVRGAGSRPFRILGVDGGGPAVKAELPAAPATSHILTLQCRPDQPGDWRRQLTIRTDLEGGATATVTVEATVQP